MPHPELLNRTPFAAELLFLADEEARPLAVPVLQATWSIREDGLLRPLSQQPLLNASGETWGDPAASSWRVEPQIAFFKPLTDVVLLGHAVAPGGRATDMAVGLRIGATQKVARIVGDRYLSGRSRMSAPAAFERIPLIWERAFGGWDRRDPDPTRHMCESRNPVGRGYRDGSKPPDEDILLPNIEDPERLFREYGDTPAPVGFGVVAPNWQPRLAYGGTYDADWVRHRRPLLPLDFDRRFFNSAAPGLMLDADLRGDEAVLLANVTPAGRLAFSLPGLPAPLCRLVLRGDRKPELSMKLDTVVIDADASTLQLTWRACVVTRNGPHDVRSAEFMVPGLFMPAQRFGAAYRDDRQDRRDAGGADPWNVDAGVDGAGVAPGGGSR